VGDVEQIEIGECTNIQDGAILHGDPGKPTILEDHVTVGIALWCIRLTLNGELDWDWGSGVRRGAGGSW